MQRILIARDEGEVGDGCRRIEKSGQQHLSAGGKCGEGDFAARGEGELLPQCVGALEGDRDIRRGLREHPSRAGEDDAPPGALRQGQSGLSFEHFELL